MASAKAIQGIYGADEVVRLQSLSTQLVFDKHLGRQMQQFRAAQVEGTEDDRDLLFNSPQPGKRASAE